MQRPGIGFPSKIDLRKQYFGKGIVRFESQYTGVPRFCFRIAPTKPVIPCNTQLQRFNVAWVELSRALQISRGFFPVPLTPLDVTRSPEYPRLIGQGLAGNFQFSQSAIIVAIPPVKILPTRKMRFASIRAKARCRLKGCFR